MARDNSIDKKLLDTGWKVIRFWGSEIIADPEKCVREIEEAIVDAMTAEYEACNAGYGDACDLAGPDYY